MGTWLWIPSTTPWFRSTGEAGLLGLASLSSQTNELLAPLLAWVTPAQNWGVLQGKRELSLCLFSKHPPSFFLPKRGKSKSILSSRDSLKVKGMPSWSLKPHPFLVTLVSSGTGALVWSERAAFGDRAWESGKTFLESWYPSIFTFLLHPNFILVKPQPGSCCPIPMSPILRYPILREPICAECLSLHWELESGRIHTTLWWKDLKWPSVWYMKGRSREP